MTTLRASVYLTAIGFVILSAAACASYFWANISAVSAFAQDAARNTPACREKAVRSALESSLQRSEAGTRRAAAAIVRAFPGTIFGHYGSLSEFRLIQIQRREWLNSMMPLDELASAYCSVGGPGADYNFPRVAARLGVNDITLTQPAELQVLADVFVFDVKSRIPQGGLSRAYQMRLAAAKR